MALIIESLIQDLNGKNLDLRIILVRTSLFQSSEDNRKNFETLLNAIYSFDDSLERKIVVAPEYVFGGPLNKKEESFYLRFLTEASREKQLSLIPGSWIVAFDEKLYNRCYVIHKGEVILDYLKRHDGGESSLARKKGLNYIAGKELGLFELDDLKCGLEICKDYGDIASCGVKDLELYFYISCGSLYRRLDCLGKGGYGIFVDGCIPRYSVLKKEWLREFLFK